MLQHLFNYKPKGLSKEQVIAEFESLLSYEKQEVIDELNYKMRGYYSRLSQFSTHELEKELNERGE